VAYVEVTGDLFRLGLPAIGHGCNCEGRMGAGIATTFRHRWPAMYSEYRRRCLSGQFRLGDVFVWEADGVVIYNLATQPLPGPTASLDAIRAAVMAALADAAERGLPRLGVPRLGAGVAGLRSPEVEAVQREVAEESAVQLVVASLG